MAERMLKELASSIVKNQEAVENTVLPKAPLSRLKSSTTVGADNGEMTIRDLRNQDWLRN